MKEVRVTLSEEGKKFLMNCHMNTVTKRTMKQYGSKCRQGKPGTNKVFPFEIRTKGKYLTGYKSAVAKLNLLGSPLETHHDELLEQCLDGLECMQAAQRQCGGLHRISTSFGSGG